MDSRKLYCSGSWSLLVAAKEVTERLPLPHADSPAG